MVNVNTEYELLVKRIYESLIKEDGISTIDVRHNVLLQGKATSYQIDIYWEYKIAGITYKTAIECKNYNSRVSKDRVASFNTVLKDIGDIKGIMVSKKGFQSGAKDLAKQYDITLKEIREAEDIDWKGFVRRIELRMTVITKNVIDLKFEIDKKWTIENNNIPKGASAHLEINDANNNVWIINDKGEKIKNFLQLENELPASGLGAGEGYSHIFKFDNGYMVNADGIVFRILSLEFIYNINESKPIISKIEANTDDRVVVKDAIDGDVMLIKKPNKE